MDILTITGVVMLVFWGAGTFAFEAPGFIHLFLSLGVMFIVLGAVKRAERARKSKN
jgi:type IV secretory pathway TrbL component